MEVAENVVIKKKANGKSGKMVKKAWVEQWTRSLCRENIIVI
jgi:hypothetical protein